MDNNTDNNKKNRTKSRDTLIDHFTDCRNQLFRFIGRIVRPDDIEDIVQETFVQSYAACNRHPIDNPRAFMFRTARNLALNSLKRSDTRLVQSLTDCPELSLPGEINPVEAQCQSEQKFADFCRAVALLPVTCRQVLILQKVYGLSQKEIAEYLQISCSTVEKHIARGMSATTQYMTRAGYHEIGKRQPAKVVSRRPGSELNKKEQSA